MIAFTFFPTDPAKIKANNEKSLNKRNCRSSVHFRFLCLQQYAERKKKKKQRRRAEENKKQIKGKKAVDFIATRFLHRNCNND